MWGGTRRRFGVLLDLGDAELADALAEALEDHPALRLVADDPDVVVTDRAAGPGRVDLGALPSGDPALVLAAALVTAAGLELVPRAPAAAAAARPRLSPREAEVLGLLVEGAPNKAIARALGISERTAKFHVAALLRKLGARNRAEAVGHALREGLAPI